LERDKAISIIAQLELTRLSKEERESILISWWGIDGEDPEFLGLPETSNKKLSQSEEEPEMHFPAEAVDKEGSTAFFVELE
jgi:hypothetical protein